MNEIGANMKQQQSNVDEINDKIEYTTPWIKIRCVRMCGVFL